MSGFLSVAARSASARMAVCDYLSKQVCGLPGRTCSRSLWLMLALQAGDDGQVLSTAQAWKGSPCLA